MADKLTAHERLILQKQLARANEQGWGIAFGLLGGLTLFLATVVLVVKGGAHPGPHLNLLGVYFPGYRVSWPGAFIGFVYAFVVAYAIGRTVATLYNRLTPKTRAARPRT
jgi:hypothetical protein